MMSTTDKPFEEIVYLKEFETDLKKLKKKWKTLPDDLHTFVKRQLNLFHKHNIDNHSVLRISNLGIDYPKIYKAKKFACRSLKGKGANTGIRVIYAYFEDKDQIEFIEIYYKGDKENEDRERINRYYKKDIE